MATLTRQFAGQVQTTVGTMYSPNCNAYLFTIKNGPSASAVVDLRAEDDAINETVEIILKEFNPLLYFIKNDASGTMHIILDKNQNNVADLQLRLRGISESNDDGSTVGANNIDVSGSLVVAASSIAITA
tara:strand:+ start:818 stop:1207 length:390 start_codon:yes stop_codon:yes gene_type:complete